jgi:drug/metabolite transporter (DMT)-like permease
MRSWVAIGAGFLAVLLIVRPDAGLVEPASLLPIVSALAYAVSALLARRLGTTEGGGVMALSATVIYGVAGTVTALSLAGIEAEADAHVSIRFLFNPWIWPSVLDFFLLALCGLIAAFGFFFLAQGYRLAKANLAAPFEYVALPWSVLWGYLFFGSVPNATMIVGAAAIATAGFYTLRQSTARAAK